LAQRPGAHWLTKCPDWEGTALPSGPQGVLQHLEPLVRDNTSPRRDLARMPIERILIEPDQQVEVVTVRHHFLRANAQAKPHMSPPHEGLIAVVGENVQSQPGADFCQVVTGGPGPITGGPTDADCHFKRLHSDPPWTPEE